MRGWAGTDDWTGPSVLSRTFAWFRQITGAARFHRRDSKADVHCVSGLSDAHSSKKAQPFWEGRGVEFPEHYIAQRGKSK
jgi:hypothetical protein